MKPSIDIAGQKFGRLTALRFSHKKLAGNRAHYWICVCDCGTEIVIRKCQLISGRTRSCGCLHLKRGGKSHKPEYNNWAHMIKRTRKTAKSQDKKNYYDRGISVCDRWIDGENGIIGFECFLMDMGSRPSPIHSIDRINNDGNYEPENCKWSTPSEQSRNQRKTRRVQFNNETVSIRSLSERIGKVKCEQVLRRLDQGWPLSAALTQESIVGRVSNHRK